MKVFTLHKKSGGHRTIYAPSKKEKKVFRKMLPDLIEIAVLADHRKVAHGFLPCRSCVTNAEQHVGFHFSVCFDLADFFDSVTENHVSKFLTAEQIKATFIGGAPRQGLPTSPIIANIAAAPMDEDIIQMCASIQSQFRTRALSYTRYADDLTISCWSQDQVDQVLLQIPKIVSQHNFKLNMRKTRVLTAIAGRRIITGVAVDHTGIHPTRRTRRKMRAARHQGNQHSFLGLLEWARLKKPKIGKRLMVQVRRMIKLAGNSGCTTQYFVAENTLKVLEAKFGVQIPEEEKARINAKIQAAIQRGLLRDSQSPGAQK